MNLAFAIIGHLVGDYLLQNDYLAQGKKKSHGICAVHCLLWTLSVCAFAGWWVWWVPLVLFVTHFAQDRWTFVQWYMRVMGQRAFAQPPMSPWSVIVVDNVMHLTVIAAIAAMLK